MVQAFIYAALHAPSSFILCSLIHCTLYLALCGCQGQQLRESADPIGYQTLQVD